jgi:hypothetical protein
MRHCRSCSLLATDDNGELHMTKVVEFHTESIDRRGSRSARGKGGVVSWRGMMLA